MKKEGEDYMKKGGEDGMEDIGMIYGEDYAIPIEVIDGKIYLPIYPIVSIIEKVIKNVIAEVIQQLVVQGYIRATKTSNTRILQDNDMIVTNSNEYLRSERYIKILLSLYQNGVLRYNQIVRSSGVEKSVIAYYINMLMKRGLIEKSGRFYRLTKSGLEVLINKGIIREEEAKSYFERVIPEVNTNQQDDEPDYESNEPNNELEYEKNVIRTNVNGEIIETSLGDKLLVKKKNEIIMKLDGSYEEELKEHRIKIDLNSDIPPIIQAARHVLNRDLTEEEDRIVKFLWSYIVVSRRKALIYDPEDEVLLENIDLNDDETREAILTLFGEGVIDMYVSRNKQLVISFSNLVFDIIKKGYDPHYWYTSDKKILDIIPNKIKQLFQFEPSELDMEIIKIFYSYTLKRKRVYFTPPCPPSEITSWLYDLLNSNDENLSKSKLVRYSKYSDDEISRSFKRLLNLGIIYMPSHNELGLPKFRISNFVVEPILGVNKWGRNGKKTVKRQAF